MFNQKVHGCSNWLEFTRTDWSGDLTRSRECLEFGLSVIQFIITDNKDLTFSRTYWDFVTQISSTLGTREVVKHLENYLPEKMHPIPRSMQNRILSEQDYTPKQ